MNDPYTNTDFCVQRLIKYYKEHGNLIVAFDWDDTCHDWHNKSFRYPRVIELLKRCNKHNFRLIPYTAATLDRYEKIRQDIASIGIYAEEINKNPVELVGNNGKIYYNILLDDRAGLGQAVEILETTLDIIEKS